MDEGVVARRRKRTASLRRVVMAVGSIVLVIALWEGYKLIGPDAGGRLFGTRLLPRANDNDMPHVWDMITRFGRAELRGSSRTIGAVVAAGAWYTLRLALGGLALGVLVGLGLAVLMARYRLVERGLLPYVIVSQTVPLIALAPLVVSWGGNLEVGGFVWQRWMSAAVIGAFLAFFPVAVGALRGLKAPDEASIELMDSYAATWWQTLTRVRFPASVPYLVPALKLAASAAVVGVIVAEISTGLKGGIGRLIIEYSREATSDPAKVYTALIAAAAVGLAMALLIAALDRLLGRVLGGRAHLEVAS